MLILLVSCKISIATNYLFKNNVSNEWTDAANWSPSYFGTILNNGGPLFADTIIIAGNIHISSMDSIDLRNVYIENRKRFTNDGVFVLNLSKIKCVPNSIFFNNNRVSLGSSSSSTEYTFINQDSVINSPTGKFIAFEYVANKIDTSGIFVNYGNYSDNNSGRFGCTIDNYGKFINEADGYVYCLILNNYHYFTNKKTATINSISFKNSKGYTENYGFLSVINPAGLALSDGYYLWNDSVIDNFPTGIIKNYGATIYNNPTGVINNSGYLEDTSTIAYNYPVRILNYGVLNNYGKIENYSISGILNKNKINNYSNANITDIYADNTNDTFAVWNNYGLTYFTGSFYNNGKLNNYSGGNFTAGLLNESSGGVSNDDSLITISSTNCYNHNSIQNNKFGVLVLNGDFSNGNTFINYHAKINNSGTIYINNAFSNFSGKLENTNTGIIENTSYLYNFDTILNFGKFQNNNQLYIFDGSYYYNETNSTFGNTGVIYGGDKFHETRNLPIINGTINPGFPAAPNSVPDTLHFYNNITVVDTIQIDIESGDGAGISTGHDLVLVDNSIDINNANLNVIKYAGFSPFPGQRFKIIEGKINGVFSNTLLPPDFIIKYYPDSILLQYNSLLPLELLSFSGTYSTLKNELKWTVVNEQIQYYVLERSYDGIIFKSIDTIKAENKIELHTYIFDDTNNIDDISYYRLKLLDIDNQIRYGPILLLKHKYSVNTDVFPNPANNTLNIYVTESGKYCITDLLGNIIFTENLFNNTLNNVDITSLGKGIYTITRASNGELLTTFIRQ